MRTDLKIHVSGYYSYHLRRDGTAVIDRYTGSVDELALPCQLCEELIDNRILLQVHHRHSWNMQEIALVVSLQIVEITF